MKINLARLRKLKEQGEPIVCITSYDAAMTYWANEAEIEMLLVGDSLGMVVQGHRNTLPVSLQDMVYHTQNVVRGNSKSWVIADIPFMTDASLERCLEAASALMQIAGADMLKLEGGAEIAPLVEKLTSLGVPVCGHLGLLPQSVLKKGYRVQGRIAEEANKIISDAKALQTAGADMLVLECVPSALAKQISEELDLIVIGIGSGKNTDGQVLVSYDVLGLTPGKAPSFSKDFLAAAQGSIGEAFKLYAQEVKAKTFPAKEHEMA